MVHPWHAPKVLPTYVLCLSLLFKTPISLMYSSRQFYEKIQDVENVLFLVSLQRVDKFRTCNNGTLKSPDHEDWIYFWPFSFPGYGGDENGRYIKSEPVISWMKFVEKAKFWKASGFVLELYPHCQGLLKKLPEIESRYQDSLLNLIQ